MSSAAAAAGPRRGLIRHADFLKLWAAETISQFGTQVSLLAVPLVAILVLRASPIEVALLGTIEFLPFLLFSLPAGVWVDRLPRRPILIVGDVGRAVSLASIPVAHALGLLSIHQLYAVGFINGVLTVFFDVAYQSYLPSLVDRDQLVEGNSKLEMSRSAAQIAGPAFGGGLVGLLSAPVAVILDSVSFVASGIFVLLIRKREPKRTSGAVGEERPREGMRREIAEGLRYVLGHRYLRYIAACTAISNLFSNLAFAVFLVFAVRDLGMSAELIGLAFGLGNVGFLVGAVGASRIAARIGVGRAILLGITLSGPAMLLIALATRELAVPFLVASGFLSGLATAIYNINQVSLRQAITAERLQGRMNATMRFIVWGTIPVGNLLGGTVATAFGLREAMWVGAIGSFLAIVPILVSPVRTLQRIPEPVDEPAGTPSRTWEGAAEAAEAEADLSGDGGRAVIGGPGPVPRADES